MLFKTVPWVFILLNITTRTHLYPILTIPFQNEEITLTHSYHKMCDVNIRGQKIKQGQCVLAQPMFPFSSHLPSPLQSRSFFCNPSLRVAEVDHFAIHTFEFNGAIYTHAFAIVKWLLPYPSCNLIGKPYLICCNFVYESNYDNSFLPLENSSTCCSKHLFG